MPDAVKILAVEDEITVQFFVTEALTHAGYQVTGAASAEEALLCLDVERPRLAIVDLGLPGMGGLELLPLLGARRPEMVAIVLSAHDARNKALAALRSGAVDFVPKPCTTADLREAVRVALDPVAARERQRQLLALLQRDEYTTLAVARQAVVARTTAKT